MNGIDVLKSLVSFNFTQVHNVAQGKQITLSVLVLLLLDSSDQDLAVFLSLAIVTSELGNCKANMCKVPIEKRKMQSFLPNKLLKNIFLVYFVLL